MKGYFVDINVPTASHRGGHDVRFFPSRTDLIQGIISMIDNKDIKASDFNDYKAIIYYGNMVNFEPIIDQVEAIITLRGNND